MGQDSVVCAKCGELCGYDDEKGMWWGESDKAICGRCKGNLGRRFAAFFGIDTSYGRDGLELTWDEVDKILSNIKKDSAMRISYIVTEKEFYEKTVITTAPVEGG